MSVRILLIEDDKKKIDDISGFLRSKYPSVSVAVKESYQSGMRALMDDEFDLLLLDMSVPTWDKTPVEAGGDYQKFGGYKILKESVRKGREIKTILVTMFDDFGESDTSLTLEQLDDILKGEFPTTYLGAIFYKTGATFWEDRLSSYLELLGK